MQYIVHILTFSQQPCVVFKDMFVLNQTKMNQLDYYKTILQKVSFDKDLFKKEYIKALSDLAPSDKLKLMYWCEKEFSLSEITAKSSL